MQSHIDRLNSLWRSHGKRLMNRTVFDPSSDPEEIMHDEHYSRLWDRFQPSMMLENPEDVHLREFIKLMQILKAFDEKVESLTASIAEGDSKMNNKCSGKEEDFKAREEHDCGPTIKDIMGI
ncbi:hypothetical protein TNIN_461341 [Trichonephila inaurata madagascariensis]|uniref:Uncharacterized protein n=1 Tax=Trichonephila inaurata madagascariensis TaxID=2747483 RepID=A0A8X7CI60_9ARAC|nr:hypothetical protein TNIN_461341 [Trichonephila inaurata madagascariensis]